MIENSVQKLTFKFWLKIFILFTSLSFTVQLSVEPLFDLVGMHFPNTFYKPGQVFFLDLYEYQQIAKSISSGDGFLYEGQETTMRSPGYPAFLAFMYMWGSHQTVILLQGFLLSLSACLYSFLCWRITRSQMSSILTGLLIIFYIPYQMLSLSLLADALFSFLLSLFIVLFSEGIFSRNRQLPLFLTAGFVLFLTTFVRPITLFIPVFLYLLKSPNRKYFRNLTFLFVVYISLLMPWTIRNYQVTARIVPVASTGAYNLWQGTYNSSVVYGESAGSYDPQFKQEKIRLAKNDYYIDYQAEKRFLSEAVKRIVENPFYYVRNCFERLLRGYLSFPGTRDWLNNGAWARFFLLAALQTSIWILAVGGLLSMDKSAVKQFIGILLLYSLIFHAAFNLITRYVLPWIPLLFVLIGCLAQKAQLKWFDKNY